MRLATLLLLLAVPAAAQTPADTTIVRDQRAFDSLMAEVRSGDRTIRVESRYFTSNNFTAAPLPGYDADRAFLRQEAVAALARVQARLKRRHLGLLIYDAYRPVRATEAMAVGGFENYDQEWWHFTLHLPSEPRFDVPVR